MYKQIRELLIYEQYIVDSYGVFNIDERIANLEKWFQAHLNPNGNSIEDQIYYWLNYCLDYLREVKKDVEAKLVKWTQKLDSTNEQQSVSEALDELLASEIYEKFENWKCYPHLTNGQEPCDLHYIQKWMEKLSKILRDMANLIENNGFQTVLRFVAKFCEIHVELQNLDKSSVIFVKPFPRILRSKAK